MQRLFTMILLAGELVIPDPGFGQHEQSTTITVRVYNYARLENSILQQAQRLAGTLLMEAGARTGWREGPVALLLETAESECEEPLAGTDVVLKLLPERMARNLNQTAETLGFAVRTWPVGLGTAFVFVHKSDQLAFNGPFSVPYEVARGVVLAHVITHEIGHLLLGPGHSETGIMSYPWSNTVVKQMARAHLAFTDREAGLMRIRLATQTKAVELRRR